MANSINSFLELFTQNEATFGGGTADFSANGYKMRLTEKPGLDGIKQDILNSQTLRDSWDDAGGRPVNGLKNGKVDWNVLMTGATYSGGSITADGLSKLLEDCTGLRTVSSDSVTSGSPTTTVIPFTGGAFVAGDIVRIENQIRRVASVAAGEITLDLPLNAAPASGVDILGCEYFTPSNSAVASICSALKADDVEFTRLLLGGCCVSLGLGTIKPGENPKLSGSFEFANFTDSASITDPTVETPTEGITVGNSDYITFKDSTGALYNPDISEISAPTGIKREWKSSVNNAVNGKSGFVAVPEDANIDVTAYQDGTYSKIRDLVGTATPLLIQIGTVEGKIFGVYYPEVFVLNPPVPADIGAVTGVKFSFKASVGIIFRS